MTPIMPLPLAANPLYDADGTLISVLNRVEQIKMDKHHRDWLHHKGQVMGRDFARIRVRFEEDERLI